MIAKVKRRTELPLVVGQKYVTKLQTGEEFRLKRIVFKPNTDVPMKVYGIFLDSQHLGECPLDPERLVRDFTVETEEITVCDVRGTCIHI